MFVDCLYEECACVNGTDTDHNPSVITWPNDTLYCQPCPESYTVAVSIQTEAGMSSALHSLRFGADHCHVTVPGGTGPGLHIEDLPDIDVVCFSNCMEYVEHTRSLVLFVHCHNCLPQENVAYEWKFFPANINCTMQTIDWEADVSGGNRKPRLIIPKRTFENITGDEGYQFIATGLCEIFFADFLHFICL